MFVYGNKKNDCILTYRKLNEKKNDVTEINSVAKGKKKISHDSAHQSDDDDDDDESDSSVHTSDMSTDDESDDNKTVKSQNEDSGCDTNDVTMATSSSLLPKTVDKSKTPPTTKTVDKIVEKDKNEAETCESKAKINRKPVVNIPVQRLPEMQVHV